MLIERFIMITGNKIDEMLGWKGDYITLEKNHRYIQW